MKIKVVCVVLTILQLQLQTSSAQLPATDIEEWAWTFGEVINKAARNSMALQTIQWGYLFSSPRVRPLNGTSLLLRVRDILEDIFSSRLQAIQNLTDMAETTYADYQHLTHTQYTYPKAKNLTPDFILSRDPFFPDNKVNLSASTVHVPTNVYDESDRILNGVRWSSRLDEVFLQNRLTSPFISWQFFCSSDGFLRNYPGIKWTSIQPVDLFDCRTRGWYIKAATSAKDVLMLVDSSGSMRGLRMQIATATILNIINTFNEDDYFNIIKYSEEPQYVEDCFNGTLVQATVSNLKRIRTRLEEGIKTRMMANLEKALVEAFELFNKASLLGLGSGCNRMIMIITDGAPSNFQHVFQKYNWPNKRVRVFTYLIGREAKDPTNIKWMACNNKGYFSHISTLADIHEHVQDYIRVLGRPLAISRSRQFVWTNIYADTLEKSLTTTLAVPVYDTKNDTYNAGNLLGVMGTDIDLSVLTNTLPKHQLGVHSYAFAVTNNGFVIFHPDHRPFHKGKLKQNYNSLDISEVEFIDDGMATVDRRKLKLPIRQHMLRRETGVFRLRMKVSEDNKRRVSIRDTTYYYIPVNHTPFSLGVAVPDGHSQNYLDGRIRLRKANLRTLNDTNILIAPWQYCWPANDADAKLSRYTLLMKYLQRSKLEPSFLNKYCYKDLVESLLFDAKATRDVLSAWKRQSKYNYRICVEESCFPPLQDSVELVFMGTKAGLTRYYKYFNNLSDPHFLYNNTETNKMLYYTRAIENGDGVLTVSVPFHDHKGPKIVTLSTPVIVSVNGHAAAAGVVGLQMRYSAFHEYFMKAGELCIETGYCQVDCTNETIDCYLLDNNAYVVFSEHPEKHLGKFFGEIDGSLMEEISTHDINNTQKLFRSVSLVDFQATCKQWSETKAAGGPFAITPFVQMKAVVLWLANKLFMLMLYLLSLCCFDIFNGQSLEMDPYLTLVAELEASEKTSDFINFIEKNSDKEMNDKTSTREAETDVLNTIDLKKIFLLVDNDFEVYQRHLNTYRLMSLTGESEDNIRQWYADLLRRLAAPRLYLCSQLHRAYVLQKNASQLLPLFAQLPQTCAECPHSKNFSVHQVPKTNLLLVTVQTVCECPLHISLRSKEIINDDSEDCGFHLLYRRRPTQCFYDHQDDNSELCHGSIIQPTLTLTLITLFINIIIM